MVFPQNIPARTVSWPDDPAGIGLVIQMIDVEHNRR